uniref:Uncharacterized protein n=1 Tax=Quercus lobata TaxID=97700 RepID=A0A7N2QYU8_QUELO
MATLLPETSKIPQCCIVLLVRSRRAIRTYLRASDNNIEEANRGPVEVSRAVEVVVEDQKLLWALQVVWPQSLEKVKFVVPSQSMQHAGWSLIQGMKNLPLTRSYGSIKALTKSINKSERGHGLVIAWLWGEVLYAWRDTITEGQNHYSMPALGSFTGCSGMILAYGNFHVSVEPGTPHGFNAISQM